MMNLTLLLNLVETMMKTNEQQRLALETTGKAVDELHQQLAVLRQRVEKLEEGQQ